MKEDMAKTKTTHTTSTELLKQSEALRRQAEEMKREEIPGVVARMKEAIAYYGLTARDLGLADGRSAKSADGVKPPSAAGKGGKKAGKKPSVVKYRDTAGNSWSGFGPKPKWFKEALAAGATEESLRAASAG